MSLQEWRHASGGWVAVCLSYLFLKQAPAGAENQPGGILMGGVPGSRLSDISEIPGSMPSERRDDNTAWHGRLEFTGEECDNTHTQRLHHYSSGQKVFSKHYTDNRTLVHHRQRFIPTNHRLIFANELCQKEFSHLEGGTGNLGQGGLKR